MFFTDELFCVNMTDITVRGQIKIWIDMAA
jgi:hypothetical protein